MAIRFSASGEYLVRTANLPSTTAFTASFWAYITSASDWGSLFSLWNSGSNTGYVMEYDSSRNWDWYYGTGSTNGGTTLPSATWFHVGIIVNGTGASAAKIYLNGTLDCTSNGVSTTPNSIRLGQDAAFSQFMNGRVAAFKLWDAVLTLEELLAERRRYLPARHTNLSMFTPLLAQGVAIDLGGNGRAWTETGTLSTEDGPPISWGAYSHLVRSPAGGTAYSLDASAGSYTMTGTAAGLEFDRELSAAAGSYTMTGTAASLELGRVLDASAGSYTMTGTAATFDVNRVLGADAGAYTVGGTAAGLELARILDASGASYTIVGTAADLYFGRSLSAEAGAYTETGTAAALEMARVLDAGAGAYTWTGADVTLSYTSDYDIAADAGAYSLTGSSVDLLLGRVLDAAAGSYTMTGTAASPLTDRILTAAAGSYAMTGTMYDYVLTPSRYQATGTGSTHQHHGAQGYQ